MPLGERIVGFVVQGPCVVAALVGVAQPEGHRYVLGKSLSDIVNLGQYYEIRRFGIVARFFEGDVGG